MRIYSSGNQNRKKVKTVTEITTSYYAKEKPSEQAKEHFRRKAYEKKGEVK